MQMMPMARKHAVLYSPALALLGLLLWIASGGVLVLAFPTAQQSRPLHGTLRSPTSPGSGIARSPWPVRQAAGDSLRDDPVLRLPLMEAQLATLKNGGSNNKLEYSESELQSAIGDAKMAAELGVRRTQSEFYDAFSNGDMTAMSGVWSTESHVRVVHPGMGSIEGREAVLKSWEQILTPINQPPPGKSSSSVIIRPKRVQIDICGLIALCSCVEETQGGGRLEALNVYKREGGAWRMTMHMAGPIVMETGSGAFF